MSVTMGFVEVTCDGPDADTDCPVNKAWMDAGPASVLRKRMRELDGWAVGLPGGVDRCPKCKAAVRPETELDLKLRNSVELSDKPTSEPASPVGTNAGHGHVWTRPDGVRARCGGPGLCSQCSRDQALMNSETDRAGGEVQ